MLRGAVILVLSFLSVGLPLANVRAEECGYQGCPVEVLSDGYRYSYVNGMFYGVAASRGTQVIGGRPVEVFYQPACAGNEIVDAQGQGGDVMCGAALAKCPAGAVLMWMFTRPVGSPAAPHRTGGRCIPAGRTVSLADAQTAALRYLRERHLPHPTIHTNPPTGGLVNLPEIVSTQPADPLTVELAQPLPATITATPHWTWSFNNHPHPDHPDTPGRPFHPGTLPADHPGYYLTHTFTTTGPATIAVTVTWQATFTVTGIPHLFPLPDLPLTTAITLPIHQARSELIADPNHP